MSWVLKAEWKFSGWNKLLKKNYFNRTGLKTRNKWCTKSIPSVNLLGLLCSYLQERKIRNIVKNLNLFFYILNELFQGRNLTYKREFPPTPRGKTLFIICLCLFFAKNVLCIKLMIKNLDFYIGDVIYFIRY